MTDRVRRNGLPASCEPCRKLKVRCDHAKPHCSRCRRRNIAQQCHYQPSPMTRDTSSYTEALLAPKSARQIDSATVSSVCTLPSSTPNPPTDESESGRGTGLVTMHTSLMPFGDPNGREPHRKFAYLTRTGLFIPKRPYPVTPAAIAEGVEVLRSLIELNADCQEIFLEGSGDDANDICGSLIFNAAWQATQSTLAWLGTRPSLDQLTGTALALFEHTACPLELPISLMNDALELALTGQRLRWEAIGIGFVHIALMCATARTKARAVLRGQQTLDRHKMMLMAVNACMRTRAFCDQVDQTNDLTLWLLVSILPLATWCFGDDSSCTWRMLGDLTSAITALGFHSGFKGGDLGPPYLVELRRRVMALAHERDKELATFNGRPPRLSHRYCSVDLPLDIPDSVMVGTLAQFEAATAKLDENGWSRDGVGYTVSRLRAMLLLNIVREEVLELSLGPPLPDIAQRARAILSKLASTWKSIPYKRYEPSMSDTTLPSANWVVIGPQLECLYTEFLLHKLLISQNEGNRHEMIRTSHEILKLALSIMNMNDDIATPHLEWMMVFYAMPCASVLILELYRQNRQPHTPTSFNRSALIQDISVLISCCDTLVISGQSNYQICKQAQTIFSRCLDQILNQNSASFAGLASEATGGPDVLAEPFHFDFMNFGLTELYPQDPEWSTWLESFDSYEA